MSSGGAQQTKQKGPQQRLRGARLVRFIVLAVAAIGALLALAGCADNSKYSNNPRPAQTLNVAAIVSNGEITVSPETFGGGLVKLYVTNGTNEDLTFTVEGERTERSIGVTANGTAHYKVQMPTGLYTFSTDAPGVEPFDVDVGPARPSSKNRVLLP